MPQMAPISWLMLFFMFSMMLMLFNMINFFSFVYNPMKIQKQKKNNSYKKLNWKW